VQDGICQTDTPLRFSAFRYLPALPQDYQGTSFVVGEQVAAHWLTLKIGKVTGQSRRQKMANYWEFQGRLRVKSSKGVSIGTAPGLTSARRESSRGYMGAAAASGKIWR
jgi:hypothetical protein